MFETNSSISPEMEKMELELIDRYQKTKDPNALRKLGKIHKRLIGELPKKKLKLKSDMTNEEAEAMVWKMYPDIVESFDPKKGYKFSTHLYNKANVIKHEDEARISEGMTRYYAQYLPHIQTMKTEYANIHGTEPSPQETYDMLISKFGPKQGLTPDYIKKVNEMNKTKVSGDQILGNGTGSEITLNEVLNVKDSELSEAEKSKLLKTRLKKAMEGLTKDERTVIGHEFGIIKTQKPFEMRDYELKYGFTPYEVGKLKKSGLAKLDTLKLDDLLNEEDD